MHGHASTFSIGPVSSAVEQPLYEQVVGGVVREIEAERLRPGEILPSVRALAAELLVSVITIKRAYEELEKAGLIYSRQGVGAFVADAARAALATDRLGEVRRLLGEAIAEARRVHLSDPEIAQMLRIFSRGTRVFDAQYSERIRVDGLAHRISPFQLGPIDLAVPGGSITALIGPNGAGKTTLLDLMFGLGEPQGGRVIFSGLEPGDPVLVRQRVGFVSPDLSYASWGRVGSVLDYVAGFYPAWDEENCGRLLDLFGLARSEKVAGLSFGARTKLSLVIAMARETDALLLDEPTTGLDPMARRHLFAELLAYIEQSARSVIISSHQLSELERLADRVAILDHGQLLASGSTDELVERFEQWDLIDAGAALPQSSAVRLLARKDGRSRVMVDLAHADFPGLQQLNVASRTPMTLEEVFLGLTASGR